MALPAHNPASLGTGKHYTTVLTWEADLDDANLDADYVGEVYGLTEDNATTYFGGGNSTASYKAILRAASGEEADGTDAKGAQIDIKISISEGTNQWNMDIEAIEFHTVGAINYTADHADNVTNILKCVFRDTSLSGIYIYNCGAAEINIGVCLFRDLITNWKAGVQLEDTNPAVKVFNCTGYNINDGCIFEKAGAFAAIKNCVSVCDEVDAGYIDYQWTPNNMSYCADSGDNTATGTGSIHTAARADEWVDYAADNFKVKNTSAHIYHAGVQITGESWFPATDMAGTTWNNPPSMGCYEHVAGGEEHEKNLSDTINMTDARIASVGLNKADSMSLSDSISRGFGLNKADSITLSDSIIKAFGLNKDDTVNLSDAISSKDIGLNRADTINLSDSISSKSFGLNKADNISLSDSIAKSFSFSKTDTINMTDEISTLLTLLKSLSDTINMSDAISSKTFGLNKSDIISLSDNVAKEFGLSKADTINMTDEAIKAFGLSLSDTITLSDSLDSAVLGVLAALYNFLAKNKTFNFLAKNKTFNFLAKNKTFNFLAKNKTFNFLAKPRS